MRCECTKGVDGVSVRTRGGADAYGVSWMRCECAESVVDFSINAFTESQSCVELIGE